MGESAAHQPERPARPSLALWRFGLVPRDEVFRALRKELARAPLWVLLRHGLKVRGLEFKL